MEGWRKEGEKKVKKKVKEKRGGREGGTVEKICENDKGVVSFVEVGIREIVISC